MQRNTDTLERGSRFELGALGWSDFYAEPFGPYREDGLIPGRVAIQFNRSYRLYAELGEISVDSSGSLRHRAAHRAELPAVGDWVAVRRDPQGGAIEAVLPRKSVLSRKGTGRVPEEQVMAANVDIVFLVLGLDHELNLPRVERYLTAARESGAQPVVLLNKDDLVDDVGERIREVASMAPDVPVHAISSERDRGLEVVRSYLRFGQTIALLGSSGVGKTTLINRLLGEERFPTQDVSLTDSKGRHTTTRRQLTVLPQGGLLMDTPGMREFEGWEGTRAESQLFADIEEIEAQCRFSNCRHGTEQGCAVQRAIAEGSLDPTRVEDYCRI